MHAYQQPRELCLGGIEEAKPLGQEEAGQAEKIEEGEMEKRVLVDISKVSINKSLTPRQKMAEFLEQIKNPYCFRCGRIPVQVCFTEEGADLESLLEDFFIHLKQESSIGAGGRNGTYSENSRKDYGNSTGKENMACRCLHSSFP
ncbi:DUF6870 family protein [Lachnospiraceae bacterium 62-35]